MSTSTAAVNIPQPVIMPQPVQAKEIETKALTITEKASLIEIRDQASYDSAIELGKAVKALRKEAEEHHRPIIDAAHKAHKAACDGLNKIDRPLAQAESTIKGKIGSWDMEQRRIAMEAERKAREEAERLQAEQIEEKIEQMEAGGASVEEVSAAIAQAKTMPVHVPAPQPTFQQAKGVSTGEDPKANIDNPVLFYQAALKSPMLRNIICSPKVIDELNKALTRMVKISGGQADIPGVSVVMVPRVRFGGR